MFLTFDTGKIEDYRTFLKVKSLPRYKLTRCGAEVPDEYAGLLGISPPSSSRDVPYVPAEYLFDYQRDISALAIRKRKFAGFLECGYGKTAILLEFGRHAAQVLPAGKCVLIVSPLMVVRQTLDEARRFYGDSLPIEQVRARDLASWLRSGTSRIGITNYEAITDDLPTGRLGGLVLDESSLLKSAYGAWGTRLVEMGKGLEWKLCLTGTPAPNDRIEFANHAVFLDQFPTVNSFLSRYFVNRGETSNRWELRPHALKPFYRSLSHWCIFLQNPATYGWKDNTDTIPPIEVHIHDIPLTPEQARLAGKISGDLFGTPTGIGSRAKLGQLAKGKMGGKDVPTNKPAYIRSLVDGWIREESTLIWCQFNDEQTLMERTFPEAVSIDGSTPEEERQRAIERFQRGESPVLISKAKVLGFGLNLQIATRQVFSGLADSWEMFHQAVKRSNRYGSTRPLNVHIPITPLERPMIETVLAKAKRIESDTAEQERLFKDLQINFKGGE